jgi:hypothetical protein
MATSPLIPKRPVTKERGTPVRTPKRGVRLHIPVPTSTDFRVVQRSNMDRARRRLKVIEEKLNEVRYLLADAPPEVPALVLREELWQAQLVVMQTRTRLRLKRGRKPQARPVKIVEKGAPEDTTTHVAL